MKNFENACYEAKKGFFRKSAEGLWTISKDLILSYTFGVAKPYVSKVAGIVAGAVAEYLFDRFTVAPTSTLGAVAYYGTRAETVTEVNIMANKAVDTYGQTLTSKALDGVGYAFSKAADGVAYIAPKVGNGISSAASLVASKTASAASTVGSSLWGATKSFGSSLWGSVKAKTSDLATAVASKTFLTEANIFDQLENETFL